jgi:hypothetical protein
MSCKVNTVLFIIKCIMILVYKGIKGGLPALQLSVVLPLALHSSSRQPWGFLHGRRNGPHADGRRKHADAHPWDAPQFPQGRRHPRTTRPQVLGSSRCSPALVPSYHWLLSGLNIKIEPFPRAAVSGRPPSYVLGVAPDYSGAPCPGSGT